MARTYDLKNVVASVAGIPFSGYGEDDAISFEWDSPITTQTKTADGDTIYSRNNDRGLTVTVTLMQTSHAHLLLYGLIETQHGDNLGIAPPVILPMPFMLVDPSTGETIASLDCVFTDRPASNKGKTVGTVVYKMHLPRPKVGPALANVL